MHIRLFKIDFHLHQENVQWSANIHQLNSDVLKRHTLIKLQTFEDDLHFSFCETTNEGEIFSSQGHQLGTFLVH